MQIRNQPIYRNLHLTTLRGETGTEICKDVDNKQVNGDDLSNPVDRAPCFDGICDSRPVDSAEANNSEIIPETNSASYAGGAILRLGTMTGPTVWSEFGRISQDYDVANLGQGASCGP